MSVRNDIYDRILTSLGGEAGANEKQRNEVLAKIVEEKGGSVRDKNNRNSLLEDYLLAIS